MLKQLKRNTLFIMALLLIVSLPVHSQAASKEYPLSGGVQYKQYVDRGASVNTINHLEVNVGHATTKVQLGLPEKQNYRASTTAIATRHSKEGNRVVGAVNASFFDMSKGYPLYLLAKDNVILNGGVVSQGANEYMNVPTAFGITADGRGLIDYFDFNVAMSHGGQKYNMTGLNHAREKGNAVIYTPQFYNGMTGTNEHGFEIVVDTGKVITENVFGQTLKGKITHMTAYGSKVKTTIPSTGFVISMQGGEWAKKFAHFKVGDEISTSFSIDRPWQDADFILASGPYLVKDGKAAIKMSASSPRAKEIAPRTVVGVSKDGKKVHLITVDGRQKHSKGMNMSQLANYLVKLGVDRAVNLDGGGSTAMGIRNYGNNNVVLANLPSNANNYQRLVSTALLAVSTAPTGKGAHIEYTRSTAYATLLAGASSSVNVQYILDANYNTLPLGNRVTLTSKEGTLKTNGLSFTTTKAGDDRININHDGHYVQSFPVKTVDAPTTFTASASKQRLNVGETATFKVQARDAAGKDIIYHPSQLKWTVEGDIGTISSDGKFVAKTAGSSGKVIATLGTKKTGIPMTVNKPTLFKDIPDNYTYYKEVELLTNKRIITGDVDGNFYPNRSLTRAHAAVIIARALNLDVKSPANPGFKDVYSTHRYFGEIAAVVGANIMNGKEADVFDPDANLTRAQMAKVVALSYKLQGTSTMKFHDVTEDMWSHEFIHLLAANNITTGYEGGYYKPYTPISRVHFSVFLYRAMNE